MKRKFYISIGFLTALTLAILLLVSGRKAESVELRAILESSAAAAQLTTAIEVDRHYQDRETKPLLGKPKQPEVRVDYEPISSYTKEDVYNEIIGFLDKKNWKREELSIPQQGYYKASFPQDHFTIVAEVQIHSQENIVSIYLTTAPR
jgi:hypothetical protein